MPPQNEKPTELQKSIRLGDFLRTVAVRHDRISYSLLMPQLKRDKSGAEVPFRPKKLHLKSIDIYRLFSPYFGPRFFTQVRAVVPLTLYLGLFQWIVLRQSIENAASVTAGLLAVLLGLTLFMEGIKLGLLPYGEKIGNFLPKRVKLPTVLFVTFMLGMGATFAEPAIGSLQSAGKTVNVQTAPYLYAMLNTYSGTLVIVIGVSVGLAALLGTLRFIYGWSLKTLIFWCMAPNLALTLWAHFDPELQKIVALAWDCGGATCGPVTLPLTLALGIGVAAAVGKARSPLSGFGIVTLASLFPVAGVLLLGIYLRFMFSPQEIIHIASTAVIASAQESSRWYQLTPWAEILSALQAIIPLILFLVFIMKKVLREKLSQAGLIAYGIMIMILGLSLFYVGLTYGIQAMGDQIGGGISGTFLKVQGVDHSPLFSYGGGIVIAAIFAWFMGIGATIAEPAVNTLGNIVDDLTNGVIKKGPLIFAVAVGVAGGILVGVLKLVFDFPVLYFLLPIYGIALALTWYVSEEFVNVAWDSSAVTTGPVTTPLILSLGLGLGNAVHANNGFGILAAASVCSVLPVLILGAFSQLKTRMNPSAIDERGIR